VLLQEKFSKYLDAITKLLPKSHNFFGGHLVHFYHLFTYTMHALNQGQNSLFTHPHHTHPVDLLKRNPTQLSLSILDFSVLLYDFLKFIANLNAFKWKITQTKDPNVNNHNLQGPAQKIV